MHVRPLQYWRTGPERQVRYGLSSYYTHDYLFMIEREEHGWVIYNHLADEETTEMFEAVGLDTAVFPRLSDAVNALQMFLDSQTVT